MLVPRLKKKSHFFPGRRCCCAASSTSPFGSPSALRFFSREDLGFSSLSVDSLSAFFKFVLGFGAFLGAGSSLDCLMREERRGSVESSVVEFAALWKEVEVAFGLRHKGRLVLSN
jgi:hypothetical protein